MTSASKLMMAAALLAVGYAVASFLGSPRAPYLSPATRAALEDHAKAMSQQPATTSDPNTLSLTHARLSPEIVPPTILSPGPPKFDFVEQGSLANSVSRGATKVHGSPPSSPDLLPSMIAAEALMPTVPESNGSARANDPRDQRLQISVASATASKETHHFTADTPATRGPLTADTPATRGPRVRAKITDVRWQSLGENTSNGVASGVTIGSTPVLAPVVTASGATAEYAGPVAAAQVLAPAAAAQSVSPIIRPQVPAPAVIAAAFMHSADLRAHIVVDGDSLERLARRYLNDSARGGEIFALNRDLLQNADLLPIGAELKIPPRSLQEPIQHVGALSTMPNSKSPYDRGIVGTVPIRPVPVEAPLAPRAQLLRPQPAGWHDEATE